jgi:hypothetical protein
MKSINPASSHSASNHASRGSDSRHDPLEVFREFLAHLGQAARRHEGAGGNAKAGQGQPR